MHCLFKNTVFLAHIGRSGLQKGPGKQGEGPKKHHDKEAALKETLGYAPCHGQTGQGSKEHARNACQGVVHNTFGHKACQHIKPCGKAHAENKEGAKDPPGHVLVPAVQVDADSQGNAAKAHHTGKRPEMLPQPRSMDVLPFALPPLSVVSSCARADAGCDSPLRSRKYSQTTKAMSTQPRKISSQKMGRILEAHNTCHKSWQCAKTQEEDTARIGKAVEAQNKHDAKQSTYDTGDNSCHSEIKGQEHDRQGHEISANARDDIDESAQKPGKKGDDELCFHSTAPGSRPSASMLKKRGRSLVHFSLFSKSCSQECYPPR